MYLLHIWKLCILFYIFVQVDSNNECGIARKSNDRIVNGRDLGYFKYPWFATLHLQKNTKTLVCGGSLIAPKYVITAAHCFKPFADSVKKGITTFESIYVIKLGINNKCMPESTQEVYGTDKVYIHEKYFEGTPYYDITLIKLDSEATNYMPICLPPARYESNNRSREMGIIIGLGKESSSAFGLPCTVKQAEVPIQPDSVCRRMLDNMKEDSSKFQGAFCAGYENGGTDTCQGDSGGPLQVRISPNDEIYMILGLTSFGFGCGKASLYGVYTDVSHYLDWIYDKLGTTPHHQSVLSNVSTKSPSDTSTYSAVSSTTVATNQVKSGQRVTRRRRPNSYKNILELLLNI